MRHSRYKHDPEDTARVVAVFLGVISLIVVFGAETYGAVLFGFWGSR